MSVLGIDFGTSNTAAGAFIDGAPQVIKLEGDEPTLPTAVFLDFDTRETLIGTAAADAMMEGREGRFMRSLKSILGTRLAREERQFMNERLDLIEVIARFIRQIRDRAEASTGQTFDRVISGRPVRFHSADEGRNAQAELDLREAYARAGFQSVDFLPEPEAAAIAAGGHGLTLIVDIGGGTSDFTLCRCETGGTEILASQGIRLGGTDIDKILNLNHAMPLVGYQAGIKDAFGPGQHPAPRAPFHDMATWEKIAFTYAPALLRDVKGWERQAATSGLFDRFATVIEHHLGHEVAYAVEGAKKDANSFETARLSLGFIERGLMTEIPKTDLETALVPAAQDIADCALDTLKMAKVAPTDLERIVYVGGSSLLGVVREKVEEIFPNATPETSEVFTAVVDGLALATKPA